MELFDIPISLQNIQPEKNRMSYNPKIHNRRSMRLKGYNYSLGGAYFITICNYKKQCLFGEIKEGEMKLNDYGIIAYDEWLKLNERFPNFEMDVFQIMPNHIHAIIVLSESIVGAGFIHAPTGKNDDTDYRAGASPAPTGNAVGAGFTPALKGNGIINDKRAGASPAPTCTSVGAGFTPAYDYYKPAPKIGDIIGAYKSLVSNACMYICKSKRSFLGKIWQRNYHDHIIRNDESYQSISDYIINNPENWNEDSLFNKDF